MNISQQWANDLHILIEEANKATEFKQQKLEELFLFLDGSTNSWRHFEILNHTILEKYRGYQNIYKNSKTYEGIERATRFI